MYRKAHEREHYSLLCVSWALAPPANPPTWRWIRRETALQQSLGFSKIKQKFPSCAWPFSYLICEMHLLHERSRRSPDVMHRDLHSSVSGTLKCLIWSKLLPLPWAEQRGIANVGSSTCGKGGNRVGMLGTEMLGGPGWVARTEGNTKWLSWMLLRINLDLSRGCSPSLASAPEPTAPLGLAILSCEHASVSLALILPIHPQYRSPYAPIQLPRLRSSCFLVINVKNACLMISCSMRPPHLC